MDYCYDCGTRLELRHLDGEGEIPYCKSCRRFVFPIFSTAVSMVVQNPDRTKILLIQQYGTGKNVLVAGYINKGEDAESAVIREVREEIGLDVHDLTFNKSEYFENTNTLMLNFSCIASGEELDRVNNVEIDKAQWFTFEEAVREIKPQSLAKRFLLSFLEKNNKCQDN